MKKYPPHAKRQLWFDGPNHAADGIVINPESQSILLIRRASGEWALPGGFVDNGESARNAAIREVAEETSVQLDSEAALVFRGIVDDPRNSKSSWIETSAYLFLASEHSPATAKDDAIDAKWFSLDDLPPLYASHDEILQRAIDYLANLHLLDIVANAHNKQKVSGGNMPYRKFIATKHSQSAFIKQHDPDKYIDEEESLRHQQYLQKEASILSHLRCQGFTGALSNSVFSPKTQTLITNALKKEDGWLWQANPDNLDNYINDAFMIFSELEKITPPNDRNGIKPTSETLEKEGWLSIDNEKINILNSRLEMFRPKLSQCHALLAEDLMNQLLDLKKLYLEQTPAKALVFCHHDAQQSNLAWHPKHKARLVDWSWADLGETGSDITNLLIDLNRSGLEIKNYYNLINRRHCLRLIGSWLGHATWDHNDINTVRFQQLLSAIGAYEIFCNLH